MVSITFIV